MLLQTMHTISNCFLQQSLGDCFPEEEKYIVIICSEGVVAWVFGLDEDWEGLKENKINPEPLYFRTALISRKK